MHPQPSVSQVEAWYAEHRDLKEVIALLLHLWPLWGRLPKGVPRRPRADTLPAMGAGRRRPTPKWTWRQQATAHGHRLIQGYLCKRAVTLCARCGAWCSSRPRGLKRACPGGPKVGGRWALKAFRR